MNYVVTQVARPKINKVPQMQEVGCNAVDRAMEVYIKNALVSLVSAKLNNPDVICILNCNFDVPLKYCQIATEVGIQIHYVPFGKYESKDEFPWAITQYKYDSMDYVLSLMNEDDCMVLLDTDTVCVQSLEVLFKEANNALLLYPIDHTYEHERRNSMIRNYQKLYDIPFANLIHYGGEFFAGNKKNLINLLDCCQKIIDDARKNDDLEPWDDEHILSIAVEKYLRGSISLGNPYIHRYWTNQFYLVSTNYYFDPVSIWHFPAEKNYGMITLFEYYERHKVLPSLEKMAAIMGLPKAKYQRWNPYRLKMQIRNKLKK